MTDDLAPQLPLNVVSIRAVVSFDGQDVSAALAEAGIFQPVTIAVHIGDDPDPADGLLGDGVTANPSGLLEIHPTDARPDHDRGSPGTSGEG